MAGGQASIPTYDLREELRIASSEAVPGMLLTQVAGMTVLPDGRVVTVHSGEGVMRVFDPSGRLLKVVGRKGDGPGEFRLPLSVGYVGDTVWVRDITHRRYHRFNANFEPIGSVTMIGNGGFYYGLTSPTTSLLRPTTGEATRFGIYDSDSLRTPIAITFRAAGHQFEIRDAARNPNGLVTGTQLRTVSSPLTAATHLELAPGGREAIVLESGELWGGKPGQFTIRRIETATGKVSAPIVVSLPPRKVTPAEADSLIKRSATRLAPRAADQYEANAKVADVYPALLSFMVGSDGTLWVTPYVDPLTRIVVNRTGTPVMRVRLPDGLYVMAASATHVWGRLLDADDVPIIVRYTIRRTGTPN
jgi:hypothetical protein